MCVPEKDSGELGRTSMSVHLYETNIDEGNMN
jgi:hypothetical protein